MKLLYNAESGLQAAHVTPCFAENCDVLVVGAGTAGAIAAIRAARGGMRVCAVDRLSFPCGMLAGAVFGYYYGAKGGLHEEIDACVDRQKTPRRFSLKKHPAPCPDAGAGGDVRRRRRLHAV